VTIALAYGDSEQQQGPEITVNDDESSDRYARFVAEPLEAGFGTTLGNALRRTLLSSLPGVAITSARIEGIEHEFSALPNAKEDIIEFLLNVKDIRIRALSDRPGKMYLEVSGEREVTAADIQPGSDLEIVNPEQKLLTLGTPDARLFVEFSVEHGKGYRPAGGSEGMPIGVIPVDAIFSPVKRVNYKVENTRVGQVSDYERLILEVWTDGTTTPVDAVGHAADLLVEQFALFSRLGKPQPTVVGRGLGSGAAMPPERYNTAIEDLNLSVRAYNCLKRSGLMTVGAILEKSEEELLALRNFGRKSYDELKDKLLEMGFLRPGDLGTSADEAASPTPMRSVALDAEEDDDEELGPVAKALLQALKESGTSDLVDDDEAEDKE
jgi:DNA-directed RNA polymerase subunit alpha